MADDMSFCQRAVIEFLVKDEIPAAEIHQRLQCTYGSVCMGVSSIGRWVKHFKDWKTSIQDVPSAVKVMGTVFWDAEGLILAEFLECGQTITAARYVQTLHKLHRALRDKRLGRNFIILHDNTRPHAARHTSEAMAKMGWEDLPHPSYSPDLTPSDYHLLGFVKDQLLGRRYETTEAIWKAVRQRLRMTGTEFYHRGIFKLPERWEKCVQRSGVYLEK